jgi:hypothetical protein
VTIPEPDYLKIVYTMNGADTLPFTFPVAQEADVRVFSYDTIEGTETTLVNGTDFNVVFTTPGVFPSAGSVVLLNSDLYDDLQFQVTITRSTARVQNYDMEFAEGMDPDQLEFELDRLTMMAQDANLKQDEAIRYPDSEVVAEGANLLPTAADRADTILGFGPDSEFTTYPTEGSSTAAAEASAAASAASAVESADSAAEAAASAATIPTFEAPIDQRFPMGNVAGTGFENSLYTMPREHSAGDIGKILGIVSTTEVGKFGVLTVDNTTPYTPTADYHPATKKYVGDSVLDISVAKFQDQKPSTTEGGASVAGSQTRTLNTTVLNEINGASLATNQITLPSGKFLISASVPAYNSVNRSKAKIVNVSGESFSDILFTNSDAGPSMTNSLLQNNVLEISSPSTFSISHYTQTAVALNGLGLAASTGDNEVYTTITILKIG